MSLTVSAPGRVCLFGEHQDYLGLPVIPCAISLRVKIAGERTGTNLVRISLPDTNSTVEFSLSTGEIPYLSRADYFRSAYNILIRKGLTFSRGIDCTLRGKIPINAGTSSSSAMMVAWVQFLALLSDQNMKLTPMETAETAYLAEVVEFGEQGGRMDQYSSAVGGVIHLSSTPCTMCKKLNMELGEIILADSGQPKDTQRILKSVRDRSEELIRSIPSLDIHSTPVDAAGSSNKFLKGILRNRDLTRIAADTRDRKFLGLLVTEEHAILRDILAISTNKIDRMVDAALNAGAAGAKINGSGGGGCMFALSEPGKASSITEALERAGGKVWKLKEDGGVKIED